MSNHQYTPQHTGDTGLQEANRVHAHSVVVHAVEPMHQRGIAQDWIAPLHHATY